MTLGDRLVVMQGGVVQQCASPSEVYQRPANRFVAGFVGTPAMNFLEGRVVREGEAARFVSPAGVLALPDVLARAAGAGGALVLGLRPDKVRVLPAEPATSGLAGAATLAADVRMVEDLGDRIDARLTLKGGTPWIARRPSGEHLRAGQVRLALDLDAAHLFEPGDHGARR